MTIIPVTERSNELLQRLTAIWERSVSATHEFLSKIEIETIKPYLPQGLRQVEHLIIAKDKKRTIAFMGIDHGRLEMLFVEPAYRKNGYGKALFRYGVAQYAIKELTVNEQNPQAVGFYEHMGFIPYKRTDCDEEGRPYPLLYMKRA